MEILDKMHFKFFQLRLRMVSVTQSLVYNSNPDLLASIQMCAHFISTTNYNTFSHVDAEALPPLIRTYSNHPTASKFTLITSCC